MLVPNDKLLDSFICLGQSLISYPTSSFLYHPLVCLNPFPHSPDLLHPTLNALWKSFIFLFHSLYSSVRHTKELVWSSFLRYAHTEYTSTSAWPFKHCLYSSIQFTMGKLSLPILWTTWLCACVCGCLLMGIYQSSLPIRVIRQPVERHGETNKEDRYRQGVRVIVYFSAALLFGWDWESIRHSRVCESCQRPPEKLRSISAPFHASHRGRNE